MKKIYPFSLTLLLIIIFTGSELYAQVPQYEKCCGTSSSQYPFKNNGGAKTQFWYNPGDFTVLPPSGTITTIYFRSQYANQAGGYDNFKVLMKQPATGTQFSTATTFETGLTTVHSSAHDSIDGSPTIGGWYAITLGTPFAYNNTLPLVVEIQYAPPFYGVGLDNFASSTTSFKKIYASSATATTGSASNGFWQDFGMDIVTICTSPPTPGNAISTPNPACQGNPVTLDLTGHSFGTGQVYQWQEATSASGPYTNLGSSQPTSSYSFTPATA